jgi:hypothetical protein
MAPPITDGVNIYATYRDLYPRDWLSYWTISGLALTSNQIGLLWWCNGFARVGGTAVVTGGDHSPAIPSASNFNLPSTPNNYNNYPSYSGQLGFAIYDGTWIWAVNLGSANIFRLHPSTLAETVYTLPASVGSGSEQLGFDGTYLYISTGSDIIVWDVATATGTLVGASLTAPGPCYYSANLGLIVVADNDATAGANIYTMPLGGGSLTLIGNATSITTNLNPVSAIGFCDGPAGNDLWASVADSSSGGTWNLVWRPSTMRTAGLI